MLKPQFCVSDWMECVYTLSVQSHFDNIKVTFIFKLN